MLGSWSRTRLRRRETTRNALEFDASWRQALAELPLWAHLDEAELTRLRALTQRFLASKDFIVKTDGDDEDDGEDDAANGDGGSFMRTLIAVQACLPVVNLDLSYYRDWRTLIVYPSGFVSEQEVYDDAGVVHLVDHERVGEAWERGPLVLSWHDVLCRGDGFNVVIHECAHKLDMLNGAVNGFPPLHADMDPAWWSRAFGDSFAAFGRLVESGREVPFDPYAADDPGEFFAVLSEAFFEIPQTLRAVYPPVYRQLSQFYRQDPARASSRS